MDKSSTSVIFALVQEEGKRKVEREINYYNLDAVISVGFRVNYNRAIQFRRWAINILKNAGNISRKVAKDKALSEFQKYRIIQDKKFESDFDKFLMETKNNIK